MQRLYVEADALFLVTRSETPKAVALTREMIRVYMAVRRGLVPPPPAAQSVDPALLAAVLRQVVEMQASVEHLRGALAASATGPAIGYHVARSNILFPLRRIAARLAFVDPVRRYRQWLAHMHKELRQRLNRGISMPYGLMPVAALPEALGYLREREAEADLRERHGAKSQPSLFPAAKN